MDSSWFMDDRGNCTAATKCISICWRSGAGGNFKGDIWTISAVGTLGAAAVSLDTVRAP
jgi:hypothetical protein